MKTRFGFTIGTIAASFVFLFIVVDRPMWTVDSTEQKIAAVAYRDNVIPFQKYGSKFFTVPALRRGYDSFRYLTDRGDRRAAERGRRLSDRRTRPKP